MQQAQQCWAQMAQQQSQFAGAGNSCRCMQAQQMFQMQQQSATTADVAEPEFNSAINSRTLTATGSTTLQQAEQAAKQANCNRADEQPAG